MSCNFRLIAGLGNPTPQYARTRHNAGFWVLDEIAARTGASFSADARTRGAVARIDVQGEAVYLLKPMQFMNRSGGAVAALSRFYRIDCEQILVVHDELDFAPGTLRLKRGGGHGGHNGLRDIIASLGSADFWRLRIGIGHPRERTAVAGYVLTPPGPGDSVLLESAVVRAFGLFPDLVTGKLDRVISEMHTVA
ncbi:aminoacyl-tRNA hydrolase [Candidatus Methylospira mobilis]|uniref:Peptidyl-tRNA hydrolase n=1 Tax=Candidatus Methylospira mobilis TaxID=1808979 RepID=A0A5Q0BKT9_9GAMM|nr:aminoacyl-tRNA hydrolase [Candidatus Methylospira mobilis]QFY43752.1 aminoacyl-tRNA hydrolase [Candidatus Methylospira mobilis]WNV04741.1 aminoacyl-tRNA hydrolase [Candidatus Methylospira mobilis]